MGRRPVLLFGGKGGVGKSTCSAAAALEFAASGHKTLLLTSDMTPSLSDILEEEIGDTVKKIDKNLEAIEVSNEAVMDRWKKKFGRDFSEIIGRLVDVEALDGESRHQLLDYIGSAPSLREETMLDLITEIAGNRTYDRIVWDTAPAGETLNLINMPKIIRKHLRAGAKVFEGLDKIGGQLSGRRSIADIMDEWIQASERISLFMKTRATFIIVANPEEIVVRQVARIIKTLRDYRMNIHGVVINRVIMNADSAILRGMKEAQEGCISELRKLAGELPIAELPLSASGMKGKRSLHPLGEKLLKELNLLKVQR